MATMETRPLSPNNSKCLSCMPYRAAVLTIGWLTMLVSACDIAFGAVGGNIPHSNCYPDYNNYYPCDYYSYYAWFAWTSIGQGVFGCVMSILLLIGILANVHGLLLIYIIGMILNALGYFGNGAVMLTQRGWYGDSVYYGAWAMLWCVIILYFVTVVATYRTWMMQQLSMVGSVPAYVYPQYLQPVPSQGIMMQPGTVIKQPVLSTVSGQIGYALNAQPGNYQPSGTYLPQGAYPGHRAYLPQGTQMAAAVHHIPPGLSPETSFAIFQNQIRSQN